MNHLKLHAGASDTWRAVQEDAFDMLDAHLLDHLRRENTGGERSPQDLHELFV